MNDLGSGLYQAYQGGLYPGGANVPPAAHRTASLAAAASIVPRNAVGAPDPEGLIVMIAVGMSNTTHEFAVFERNADADPTRNARVVLMDTAFGGQTAAAISNPSAAYWTTMQQRLTAMGLSAAQVQVAWLKEADAQPLNDFPGHATTLRNELELIANDLHDKFPNLKLCYVSSRIYGGYAAQGSLNPEPQAYESGFSAKWLIEDQINGDPGLNYGQLPGPVRSPLLLWGPYLWADGTTPRSDGLTWQIGDLEADHTHPSPSGEQKVAAMLAAFFAGEPSAAAWWPRRDDAALVTVGAVRDAHVSAAAPNTNFGGAAQLLVQGGASPQNTYLSFDLTGVDRPARLAKLSLRVADGAVGRVSLVNNPSWNESTITYANAPAIGAALVEMPQSTRDGTIAANVTNSVNSDADGLVGFALTTTISGVVSYVSREAGQPPRLVLVVSCLGAPPPGADPDGDGHRTACDCAPGDPTAFARPSELANLRWLGPNVLAWDAESPSSGSGTRYDLMSGPLDDVAQLGPGADDQCHADDISALQAPDPTAVPAAGKGRYFLVRGDNACGAGRYETATSGQDRLATACP